MTQDDEKILDVDFYIPMIVKTDKSKYVFFYNSELDEIIPNPNVPQSIVEKMKIFMNEMKEEVSKEKEDQNGE
jgi:hypothetical protein